MFPIAMIAFQSSISLIDSPLYSSSNTTTMKSTPPTQLSSPLLYLGWLKKTQWVQIALSNIQPNQGIFLTTPAPWLKISRIFLSTPQTSPRFLSNSYPLSFLFISIPESTFTLDIELEGLPMIVAPRIYDQGNFSAFFVRSFIVMGIEGGIFFLLWLWYLFTSIALGSINHIWKAINFFILGLSLLFVTLPHIASIIPLLLTVALYGISWNLYQIFRHPELKRPDMIVLHSILILLFVTEGITCWISPLVSFIVLGIALHLNIILLIFYHNITSRKLSLPFHLLLSLAALFFFWELMGAWFPFSPLSPFLASIGILSYLAYESFALFKKQYLDQSIYTFYRNTNRLLKSHLAQKNARLQELVQKLQKESLEKAQLTRLYEAQQRKYRNLVENLSDWIWEMNTRFVVTYTSPRVQHILSLDPNTILNQPLEKIFGREAILHLKQAISLANGSANGHLISYSSKDKNILLEISTTPLIENNKIQGYRCIGRDVTQLIAMRSSLTTYEEKIAILFEKSPLATAIIDIAESTFVRWNHTFDTLFSLSRATLDSLIEQIPDPYGKDVYFFLKNFFQRENQHLAFFFIPILSEGQTHWISLQAYKVEYNQKPYLVINLSPPSLHFFETSWKWIENWPLPVVLMNTQGEILLANQQAKNNAFTPTLPSPLPQEITTISTPSGELVTIIPCKPLLILAIKIPNASTTTALTQILHHFPLPWVITDQQLTVIEYHPHIFEAFRFQSSHPSFLSQMLRESGIVRSLAFVSSSSLHSSFVYLQNRQGEVFPRKVYATSYNNLFFFFFAESDGDTLDEEWLSIFTDELTSFHELLTSFANEFTATETPSSPLPSSEDPTPKELEQLTETEKKILIAVVEGKSNADIASMYSITEETVKGHIKHIFKKLGVQKRYQLIQRYHGKIS